MGRSEITTEEVLKVDIPWETYMSTKLITGTDLQLLRRYDKKSDSQKAASLDDLLYETCLCIWLLSYYDAAVDYLATTRVLPRLVDVVKCSTKEKVVRVVILTLCNLLPKAACGAQMIDLGLPQIVHFLKAQAWSDEDLFDALNQLEEGLKEHIKTLSSLDKYKQEVLLGHLDWYPMRKDPRFWRENVTKFEEMISRYTIETKSIGNLQMLASLLSPLPMKLKYDVALSLGDNWIQILRVLITILDTSSDPTALAVACHDLSQFIEYHPAGRIIVSDLKAKDRVIQLMNHENAEVTKNALLCVQRLFLGSKYASILQK